MSRPILMVVCADNFSKPRPVFVANSQTRHHMSLSIRSSIERCLVEVVVKFDGGVFSLI
jgi:hypothetical protein